MKNGYAQRLANPTGGPAEIIEKIRQCGVARRIGLVDLAQWVGIRLLRRKLPQQFHSVAEGVPSGHLGLRFLEEEVVRIVELQAIVDAR